MGIEAHLDTPLAEVVRKAGSQSEFARIVGRNQSTVFDWLRMNKPLPAELVLKVEAETGVSRHVLRPDIYPLAAASVSSPTEAVVVEGGAPIVAFDRGAALKAEQGA